MAPPSRRSRLPAWGLVVAGLLMLAAVVVPVVTGREVHADAAPLYGEWDPRVGIGTLAALPLAVWAVLRFPAVCRRLPWRRMLALVYVLGLAWMLALALVDGLDGIAEPLQTKYDYLPTARATTDLSAALQQFVDRIPVSAQDHWPVHVAGHPPGALVFFVVLVRLGLGGGLAAGLVVAALAATASVAVLSTVRTLGAEDLARRAAPFLVFAPAAIWHAVSADALFAAVASWGAAALAVAATTTSKRSLVWSVAAGLLLGSCVLLSYGLALLGFLAVGILILARSWFPLVPAALAASAVVLVFAVAGFAWWEALPVLQERYWSGLAQDRPASYWLWGNLAALLFSAGPMLAAGLAHAAGVARARPVGPPVRVVIGLSAAGVLMVLAADLSLLSKAEVERIWLPFVPWLLLSCALLPERWRRAGLLVQVAVALLVQHLLFLPW